MNTFFLIVLGIASVCFIIYEINSSIQIGKAQYRLNKRIKQNSYVISRIREKSKDSLCEHLCEYCVDASEQLTSYLKEDPTLYSKCININPLDTTNVVYTLYLFGRLLSTKYSETDVVNVISSTMSKFGADNYTYDAAMGLMQFCMASFTVFLEECESEPDIDLIDAMTLFYFNLVIEDREYAYDQSDEILISPAYRKIHNYFEGIMSHPIVNENYGLQIK